MWETHFAATAAATPTYPASRGERSAYAFNMTTCRGRMSKKNSKPTDGPRVMTIRRLPISSDLHRSLNRGRVEPSLGADSVSNYNFVGLLRNFKNITRYVSRRALTVHSGIELIWGPKAFYLFQSTNKLHFKYKKTY